LQNLKLKLVGFSKQVNGKARGKVMAQGHLVGVLIRLFSIYMAVSTLRLWPAFLNSTYGLSTQEKLWLIAIDGTVLVLALLMWMFNLALAKKLFYADNENRALDLAGVIHLEHALFSATGLWLVCSAVIKSIDAVFGYAVMSWHPDSISLNPQIAVWISAAIQAALGLYLLVGSKGLINLLARFRGRP
jgi:uncharacterized membrane protein YjgN (DUF898 family)